MSICWHSPVGQRDTLWVDDREKEEDEDNPIKWDRDTVTNSPSLVPSKCLEGAEDEPETTWKLETEISHLNHVPFRHKSVPIEPPVTRMDVVMASDQRKWEIRVETEPELLHWVE